jgi:hypothetical protein
VVQEEVKAEQEVEVVQEEVKAEQEEWVEEAATLTDA